MRTSDRCRCSDHRCIKAIPSLGIRPALLLRGQHELGMTLQPAMNLFGVLGRVHGAGGVHDPSARLEQWHQGIKKASLKLHQIGNRRFADAPARIRVTGAKNVTCWGTGSPMREFLHVDDLGKACVFALENWSALDQEAPRVGLDRSDSPVAGIASGL